MYIFRNLTSHAHISFRSRLLDVSGKISMHQQRQRRGMEDDTFDCFSQAPRVDCPLYLWSQRKKAKSYIRDATVHHLLDTG